MDMLYDGAAPLVRTIVVGVLAYVFLVIILRISGKRTLSKMNTFDFVVTIALGSTLASMFVTKEVALAQGILGLSMLILLQWINTFLSVHFPAYQNILKGDPTLLVYDGQFLERAMRRERVTREEILAAARQQQITEPTDIDAVIIETDGSLSVIGNGVSSREKLRALGVGSQKEHRV